METKPAGRPIWPIDILLTAHPAVAYYTRRCLLDEDIPPEPLWELQDAQKLLKRQLPDGSWPHGSQNTKNRENYYLLETYNRLRFLIEVYHMDMKHPAVQKAAAYIFSRQTGEGDIRGIFGSQYAPHYTAGMIELLQKAGYRDGRIDKALQWFLDTRQEDGGWAWPLRTARVRYADAIEMNDPVKTDKSKPFSHCLTGFVLRAFAVHPAYKTDERIVHAGALLVSRFFEKDTYQDRRDEKYWTSFTFPYWFTDLLSALDTLHRLGFTIDTPNIQRAFQWLKDRQQPDGLFDVKLLRPGHLPQPRHFITAAILKQYRQYTLI